MRNLDKNIIIIKLSVKNQLMEINKKLMMLYQIHIIWIVALNIKWEMKLILIVTKLNVQIARLLDLLMPKLV